MSDPRALIAAAALALMASTALAKAEDFDPGTKAAIQDVVKKQLEALDRGDGAAAEALASPAIRDKFPDPAKFLDMVKGQYGALIHPKSTQFTGVETSPHGPLQRVTVVAADGTVWSAIYSFEKIGDEWRITGCGIEEDKDQQAI